MWTRQPAPFAIHPIADIQVGATQSPMIGRADVTARIAAISYSLVIEAVVWFTFAWGGLDGPWQVGELLSFLGIALSPIPVCVLCFRRRA